MEILAPLLTLLLNVKYVHKNVYTVSHYSFLIIAFKIAYFESDLSILDNR